MEVKLRWRDKLKWREYQDLAGCPCPWHYSSLKWVLLASISPWLSSSPRLSFLHKSILHLRALVLHPLSLFSASGQCFWFSLASLCSFSFFKILSSSCSLSPWDAPFLSYTIHVYQQHYGFGSFAFALRPFRHSLWLLIKTLNSLFCHYNGFFPTAISHILPFNFSPCSSLHELPLALVFPLLAIQSQSFLYSRVTPAWRHSSASGSTGLLILYAPSHQAFLSGTR